jgi:hypothetical protein
LIDKAYQVCIIDPEGDYSTLQALICLGNQQRAPLNASALSMLFQGIATRLYSFIRSAADHGSAGFANYWTQATSGVSRTQHWYVETQLARQDGDPALCRNAMKLSYLTQTP